MRRALLLGLSACSFRGATSPEIDATEPVDAKQVDARPSNASCQVGASSATGTDRGKVGLSTGGGTIRPLACDGGTRLVGLALDMSDGPVNGGTSRSAHGIRIGCAEVMIDAAGGHTGTITMKDQLGFNGAGFSPATMTPTALCPPGAVLSGLQVHGSSYVGLFLDATMTCSTFNTDGELTGTSVVPIAGSLSDPLNPSGAQCSAGEQVVSMPTNMGAGLDSLHLFCAPTICE